MIEESIGAVKNDMLGLVMEESFKKGVASARPSQGELELKATNATVNIEDLSIDKNYYCEILSTYRTGGHHEGEEEIGRNGKREIYIHKDDISAKENF